jgi:hypothetical protein
MDISEDFKFKFQNKEDCLKFEELLERYNSKENIGLTVQPSIHAFNLEKAFHKFIESSEPNHKIFYWIFDIKLSYYFLQLENYQIHALANEINSIRGDLEKPVSSLDVPGLFPAHMRFQKLYPAYTLRYRALWDKLMQLLVLFYKDEELKGKSKIKAFKKIAPEIKAIPKDFSEGLGELLDAFNRKYRTSEAHGSGYFRKYSFITLPRGSESPIDLLISFSNALSHAIPVISAAILDDLPMPEIPFPNNVEPECQGYFHVLRNELKKEKHNQDNKSDFLEAVEEYQKKN